MRAAQVHARPRQARPLAPPGREEEGVATTRPLCAGTRDCVPAVPRDPENVLPLVFQLRKKSNPCHLEAQPFQGHCEASSWECLQKFKLHHQCYERKTERHGRLVCRPLQRCRKVSFVRIRALQSAEGRPFLRPGHSLCVCSTSAAVTRVTGSVAAELRCLYSRSSGGCGPSADHAPPETLEQDPSCVLLLLVVAAALGLRLRDSMSALGGPGSHAGLSAPASKVPLLSGHQSLPRAHPDHICRGRHSQLAGLRGCPRLCGRTQFLLQSANGVGLQ